MINKQIAGILGAGDEEIAALENTKPRDVITVEPHEIILVDNPALPRMDDIEIKHVEAEKELQQVITSMLDNQQELFKEAANVEPRYRSRYIEVANQTTGIALDEIKTKLKSQEERKKMRLKEAEFTKPANSTGGDGDTTNNFYFGSREDLLAMIDGETDDPQNIEPTEET